MSHEYDRVSVILEFRNGNGNKLRLWRGRFIPYAPEHLESAAAESYADAVARKSSLIQKDETPHRD